MIDECVRITNHEVSWRYSKKVAYGRYDTVFCCKSVFYLSLYIWYNLQPTFDIGASLHVMVEINKNCYITSVTFLLSWIDQHFNNIIDIDCSTCFFQNIDQLSYSENWLLSLVSFQIDATYHHILLLIYIFESIEKNAILFICN